MPQIDLGGTQYPSFASITEADIYLAADVGQFAAWDALTDDQKARSLISASRHLSGLTWRSGSPPAQDDIPTSVRDVCSILASLVATDPELLTGEAGESNVRRAGAGSAQVEFFSPTQGRILPKRLSRMLGDLVTLGSRGALPFDASDGAERNPDREEFGINGPLT